MTTAELLPGDLLQAARFGDPGAIRSDGSLPAPAGTEEVSVTLERQRAAGGALAVGDLVGALGSYDTLNDGPEVSFALDGVTVTRVAVPADPDGVWTITLALDSDSADSVVAAQAQGRLWLSLQAAGTAIASESTQGSSVASDGGTDIDTTTSSSGSASTSGDNS